MYALISHIKFHSAPLSLYNSYDHFNTIQVKWNDKGVRPDLQTARWKHSMSALIQRVVPCRSVHAWRLDTTRVDSIDPRGGLIQSRHHANPWPEDAPWQDTACVSGPLIRHSGMVRGANHVNTRSSVQSRRGKLRRSALQNAQEDV